MVVFSYLVRYCSLTFCLFGLGLICGLRLYCDYLIVIYLCGCVVLGFDSVY